MDQILETFKCQYYQQMPPKSFHLFNVDPSESDALCQLQSTILTDLLIQPTPEISISYRLLIMKHMMRRLEASGNLVDEELTEHYAETLAANMIDSRPRDKEIIGRQSTLFPPPTPGETVKVHYCYAKDSYFSINESPSILVAEGTTGQW